VHFVFDLRKAIAATSYLCRQNGGSLNVLHLIKMLYVADRTALLQWHRTITGDRFVSMKNGPVLSRVYDLMCGRSSGQEQQAWTSIFHPRDGHVISLKGTSIDLGSLSRRELDVLDQAFKQFKDVPVPQLVQFLHNVLPEWKDPGRSSAPIDPRTVLYHAGYSEVAVAEIEEELELVQSARVAFQPA